MSEAKANFTEDKMIKNSNGFYNRFAKRIIDITLAIPMLLLLLPVFLIVSLMIVFDSGFPIFYRPVRGGYKNKPFRIFKFRSMVKNADKIGGGTTALNDSRITNVGSFLRKTKLDEIPQLFNIISGEMSFIGPRPELLRYTNEYDFFEKYILSVRPGITDFSSLEFINLDEIVGELNADEMYEKNVLKRKNQIRLRYVGEMSFLVDVQIFFLTVIKTVEKAIRVIMNRSK